MHLRNLWPRGLAIALFAIASNLSLSVSTPAQERLKLWPGGRAAGDTMQLEAEGDQTKPGERPVAGKPVIRLGNVSEPEIHFYPAPEDKANGTCVVVCPGGGHRILAWDLEGTEVAGWLNELGISAAVLKYRVPARSEKPKHTAAVQDAQRALSIVRSRASEWKIEPDKIGILGFSAGGETAALAALLPERLYARLDAIDDVKWLPNFAVLIYPAYLANAAGTALQEHVKVDEHSPPMFLVHAADDSVQPESSVLLWLELKRNKIPAELHVFSRGGHGYGLRATAMPVTSWPHACAAWLQAEKWIPAKSESAKR